MNTEQNIDLGKMVNRVLKMKGAPSDPEILEGWIEILSKYDFGRVRQVLTAYLHIKVFRPDVADVVELLGGNDSAWPSPEESWNLLPKTEDEGGWMCQEMATAMSACADSLNRGDLIAARMAYLEVYKREIRGKAGDPKWWLTEPLTMDHEARMYWKQSMVALKPEVKPQLRMDIAQQLEAEAGIQRTGGGLVRIEH